MDKHTRRYLGETFGMYSEEVDFFSLADCVNQAESEDDFAYISHAVLDISDEIERNVLKEQLLKKRMGWA